MQRNRLLPFFVSALVLPWIPLLLATGFGSAHWTLGSRALIAHGIRDAGVAWVLWLLFLWIGVFELFSRFVRPQLLRWSLAGRWLAGTVYASVPLIMLAYWVSPGELDGKGLAELVVATVPGAWLGAVLLEAERRPFLSGVIAAVWSFVPVFLLGDLSSPFSTLSIFAVSSERWALLRYASVGVALSVCMVIAANSLLSEERDRWLEAGAWTAAGVSLFAGYLLPAAVASADHVSFFKVIPAVDVTAVAAVLFLRYLRAGSARTVLAARTAFAASLAATAASLAGLGAAWLRADGSLTVTVFAAGQLFVLPWYASFAREAWVSVRWRANRDFVTA